MSRSGKKSLFLTLALMLVWVATPATAQKIDNLCAGQNQNVGTVTVTDSPTQVSVRYDITVAGAFITETHAHVANSLAGIPQTKKNNPIPGQFSQKADHSPGVTTFTHTFTRPAGDPLYVAAHAVVVEVEGGGSGVGEVVNQSDPIITVSNSVGAQGDPTKAIVFGDGFYSLGPGGELIAEYRCPLAGGVGQDETGTFLPDINIWEVSLDVPPYETALISVSPNGSDWTNLGPAANSPPIAQYGPDANGNSRTVLSLGGITNARYIRVRDTSQPGDGNGFDLEAIKSRQICTPVFVGEETAWGGACKPLGTGVRFTAKGNWGTYLSYTPTTPFPN